MPRYFFDVSDGRCAADVEGVVLADNREARREVIRRAAMLLKVFTSQHGSFKSWRIALRDEAGSVLYWIDTEQGVSLASSSDQNARLQRAPGLPLS